MSDNFTDDDLKFWRELGGDNEFEDNVEIHPTTLKALIARLEAAERVIEACGHELNVAKEFDAWRKAAGK